MFRVFLTALVLMASLVMTGRAYAYQGVIADPRYGQHPYETRRIELKRRQSLEEHRQNFGYFLPINEIYYHPSFARRRQLHPFYRQGGRSIGSRYSEWRGYLPPHSFHNISHDTRCLNYLSTWNSYGNDQLVYGC